MVKTTRPVGVTCSLWTTMDPCPWTRVVCVVANLLPSTSPISWRKTLRWAMCWCWWEILMPTQLPEHSSPCGVIFMPSTTPSPLEAWTISWQTWLGSVDSWCFFFSFCSPKNLDEHWYLICLFTQKNLMKLAMHMVADEVSQLSIAAPFFADWWLSNPRLARATSCWVRRSAPEAATTKQSRRSSAWETRHRQEKRRSPCPFGCAEDAFPILFLCDRPTGLLTNVEIWWNGTPYFALKKRRWYSVTHGHGHINIHTFTLAYTDSNMHVHICTHIQIHTHRIYIRRDTQILRMFKPFQFSALLC